MKVSIGEYKNREESNSILKYHTQPITVGLRSGTLILTGSIIAMWSVTFGLEDPKVGESNLKVTLRFF